MIITPTKFCVFTALLRRLSRKIVQQGFDHRLSGDRGLYGQGLYFTTDFCKAAKHWYDERNGRSLVSLAQLGFAAVVHSETARHACCRIHIVGGRNAEGQATFAATQRPSDGLAMKPDSVGNAAYYLH